VKQKELGWVFQKKEKEKRKKKKEIHFLPFFLLEVTEVGWI
jgi:hypothetical protein